MTDDTDFSMFDRDALAKGHARHGPSARADGGYEPLNAAAAGLSGRGALYAASVDSGVVGTGW